MGSPNTLFLLYKHGLRLIDKKGVCESGIWQLSDEEQQMKFLSLHRSKSDRAYKGGEILEMRQASQEDIEDYYKLTKQPLPDNIDALKERHIVTFQIDRDWNVLWPEDARKNPMANKGTGHIELEAEAE